MRRHQVFTPEDLALMDKVLKRANDIRPGETNRAQLAKAIVMTYRRKATEAALAAAALHLVDLNYLN